MSNDRTVRAVIGIGLSTRAIDAEIAQLVDDALAIAGVARSHVQAVATRVALGDDRRIHALGWPVMTFPDAALNEAVGAESSAIVGAVIPTASVCEAAALLGAGPSATLTLPKLRSAHATVAIATTRTDAS